MTQKALWLPPAVREDCARTGRVSPSDVCYYHANVHHKLLEAAAEMIEEAFRSPSDLGQYRLNCIRAANALKGAMDA